MYTTVTENVYNLDGECIQLHRVMHTNLEMYTTHLGTHLYHFILVTDGMHYGCLDPLFSHATSVFCLSVGWCSGENNSCTFDSLVVREH